MDKSVLKKALADSPDPTPGYLFRDIAQMTFGDQATQTKLVAYLNDKLAPKNSVHVLAKTLKVIKVLCETGHTDFQKEFQRQSDFLKQFAQYRGPQDSKFGDAYNERVRTNAKEAIDAAFSPRKETRIGSMAGHGSDATTTAHDGGSSKGFVTGQAIGTAPGTGAHCAPMPTTNKWAEHMATKNQPTGSSSSGAAKNVKEMVTTGFGLWKEGVKSDEDRMREAGHSTVGEFRAVEIPVAGFGGDSGFGGGGGSSDGGWKFTEDQSSASGALPAVQEARMLTALQKEVERIVAFKSSPQRVDLTHFLENTTAAVARAGTWEDLAEALDAKLAQSVPWQQRLNALCCIEHLVRNKVGADFDAYFVSNPEDVQRNVFVVQNSLKEKASKVLKMLGIPDKSTAPKPAAPTAAAAAAGASAGGGGATTTTNFDGNVTWGSAQPEPAAAPAGGGDNLDFGGMQVKPSTTRRGRNAGASAAEEGGTTKLRKRATMAAAAQAESEPEPPTGGGGFGGGGDWGSAPSASGGDGGWGNTAGNDGGWGSTAAPAATASDSSWGAPAPAASQQQQPAPAAGATNDFDALFGAPSPNQPSVKPAQQPPLPDASTSAVTDDFIDSMIPPKRASPAPAPAPAQQPPQQQQQPAGSPHAAMLQQQQQMLQMLQSQMQQVMTSSADANVKAQQMQALMQQQQQIMSMMQMMNAQQQQPQQQPQQQLPPQQQQQYMQQQAGAGQFAALNEEMKRSMGY